MTNMLLLPTSGEVLLYMKVWSNNQVQALQGDNEGQVGDVREPEEPEQVDGLRV